jgi:hypothetical protein
VVHPLLSIRKIRRIRGSSHPQNADPAPTVNQRGISNNSLKTAPFVPEPFLEEGSFKRGCQLLWMAGVAILRFSLGARIT